MKKERNMSYTLEVTNQLLKMVQILAYITSYKPNKKSYYGKHSSHPVCKRYGE
jgi:hypothetical protein